MKIYVINLKHRSEKLKIFFENLPDCIDRKNIDVFEAIDGNQYSIPKWFGSIQRCTHGRYGCYMSHLKILENITETTLIFEDDVIFKDNFCEKFIKAQNYCNSIDYDIFYLGGGNMMKPTKIHDDLYRCVRTQRTHAYIIKDKSAANKIIKYISDPNIWKKYLHTFNYHIDQLYGKLQLDQKINAYTIMPFICGQSETSSSDVSPQVGPLKERWDREHY